MEHDHLPAQRAALRASRQPSPDSLRASSEDPALSHACIGHVQVWDCAVTATPDQQLHELHEALRALEGRYRTLEALSSDWYWEHDEQQRFTSISAQMLEKTGISVAEMLGRTRWETDIRYDPAKRKRLEEDIAEHRPFYDFQFDRVLPDGTLRHLSVSGAPMFDCAGRYVGHRGIGKDLTERRREQSVVRESQVFARAALDALVDQVCVLDAKGIVVAVNSAWRRVADSNGAAAIGAFMGADYLAVCDRASGNACADGVAVGAGLRDVLAGKAGSFQYEYEFETPAGARWAVLKASSFETHGDLRVLVAHEDITERRQAAARLVQINNLYQALSDTSDAVRRSPDRDALLREVAGIAVRAGLFRTAKIWIRDEASQVARAVVCVDAAGECDDTEVRHIELSGARARGPTGMAILHGLPDVCNDALEERSLPWRAANERAGVRSSAAFPLREDGKVIGALSVYATRVGYFDAKFVELLSRIAADVSFGLDNRLGEARRTAAEAALRESEARFRSLTELSADWYWQQDENLRFTEASGGTAISAALRSASDLGKTRWELPLKGVSDEAWHSHKVALAARLPFRDFEFSRTGLPGDERDGSVSGAPFYDADGRFAGYRGIGTDLTERKHDQRLMALEQQVARCLAGGGEALDTLGKVIEVICESQGWLGGSAFAIDERSNDSRLSASWSSADLEVMPDADRRNSSASRSASLASQVCRSDQPLWMNDSGAHVSLLAAERLGTAVSYRGFGFPIAADRETLGALTFFGPQLRPPDERLDAVARSIGGQVGQFLKRRHAEEALRESEARFRSLSDLSADWYWQQDGALRFTSLCNGTEIEAGLAPDADWGKTRWELTGVASDHWEEHKRTLAEHRAFVDFEMRRAFPDGSVRDICISGTPVFDAAGNFIGYRGVGRDITDRKRDERILALEHQVARCIADATDASSVVEDVLKTVCMSQEWSFGVYLRADEPANVLRVDTVWAQPLDARSELMTAARTLTIGPGEGVAGVVWQNGEAEWIDDAASDPRLLLSVLVVDAGYRAGFAFPVKAEARTTGVLLFFSREVRKPDARILAAARMIGAQIGQFLQRCQAEDALRESEKRYRALTELSSDWYWEHDANQRFTRVSEGIWRRSGIAVDTIIGYTRWELGISYDTGDRLALDARIEARQPFHDFAYRRPAANGVVRHMLISGEPMYDASGQYGGYRGIGRDVTERKHAEDQLRFQAMLLNTVGDAVMASDTEGSISYWSAAAEQLYGWTSAEAMGLKMQDMVQPANDQPGHTGAMHAVTHGGVWRGEKIGHRRDRTTFPAHLTLAPLQDANGVQTGMVGVSRDISDLKRAEQVIQDSARQQGLIAAFGQRALARTTLDNLLDDAAAAVIEGLSLSCCRILQRSEGAKPLIVRAERSVDQSSVDRHALDSGAEAADWHVPEALEPVVVDDFAQDARYASMPSLARHGIRSGAHVVIGGATGPFGILGAYASDIARFDAASVSFLQSIANNLATAIDRMAAEEKVAYLAQFDALTGLPNCNLFRERMTWTLTQAQRNNWSAGVMFIDLDRFKAVNDTFGHGVGDRLLIMVAERLRHCVRAGDTVGRLSGDEFVVVLSNLSRVDDADLVAQQIVEELARPFILDAHELRITASIGISLYPADGHDSEHLLRKADAAMYLAKQKGRNGFHFYTEEVNARVTRRMELEVELRRAIANEEFVLHYQPQVSLHSGRIVGMEALVRWQHPVRGLLAPAEFIGVAEETGLIVPIGRWVARRACAQAAQWHQHGHPGLFVAINVSPLEFRRGNVPQSIREALAESGLDARCLEIELTETLIMDGADSFIRSLEALKATGVSISIDDFGTGYSSLSYLKRFPIDKIKIDRAFVRDIVSDEDDAAIAQAIIAMSHHLKLSVTAEGVETEEQAHFLRRSHCDVVQGFLFSRPVDVVQMTALLDGRTSMAVGQALIASRVTTP